jgi:5-methylcytosine-specific restriction endonuclease McrA
MNAGLSHFKICLGCDTLKPISAFNPQNRKESYKKGLCHECVNLKLRLARMTKNKSAPIYHPSPILKTRIQKWATTTYCEHSQRYQITFSLNWLKNLALASTNCGICGVEFDNSRYSNGNRVNRRSLDRTNNDLILTPSNVQVICCSCNAKKGNMTLSAYLATIRESKTPLNPNDD